MFVIFSIVLINSVSSSVGPFLEKSTRGSWYPNTVWVSESYCSCSPNVNSFGVDISKLNFVIFTVINLNPDKNNPPNPPYINLNDLIYKYHLKKYSTNNEFEEIKTCYNELIDKVNGYSFYSLNPFHKIESPRIFSDIDKNIINNFIKIVRNNNAATLIGSLESTDELQNTVFNNFYTNCILNEEIFKDIYTDKFHKPNQPNQPNQQNQNDAELKFTTLNQSFINIDKDMIFSKQPQQQGGNNKSKQKYLKYKNKYLELKKEMIDKGLI